MENSRWKLDEHGISIWTKWCLDRAFRAYRCYLAMGERLSCGQSWVVCDISGSSSRARFPRRWGFSLAASRKKIDTSNPTKLVNWVFYLFGTDITWHHLQSFSTKTMILWDTWIPEEKMNKRANAPFSSLIFPAINLHSYPFTGYVPVSHVWLPEFIPLLIRHHYIMAT